VSNGRYQHVRTTWTEAFAGFVLARPISGRLEWDVHAEGLVQRVEADADVPGAGSPTNGARWLGGGRLGADLRYWAADTLGVFVGVSGQAIAGVTTVRVADEGVGTATALGYVARAGISFGMF